MALLKDDFRQSIVDSTCEHVKLHDKAHVFLGGWGCDADLISQKYLPQTLAPKTLLRL